MLFPTSIILASATLLGSAVEAAAPKSVTVTSFSANKRCGGASTSQTVAPGNACRTFAGGASSYFVNVDSERCVLITYSSATCTGRISRRELEHDVGDDDQDCERLPKVAQTFKIKCGVDDHGGDNKMLRSRFARHGQDDHGPDDHGHDGHGHDDHGRHHGHDDHGRHHGHDDHGRHHGRHGHGDDDN